MSAALIADRLDQLAGLLEFLLEDMGENRLDPHRTAVDLVIDELRRLGQATGQLAVVVGGET